MSKKLWGGRFKKEANKEFFEFQKSLFFDKKLAEYDVMHSIIHVVVLKKAGILTKAEAAKIYSALKDIQKDIKNGSFKIDPACEDIHTLIHNSVEKKVGNLAGKLHTLRSRNDQVVFDEKSYCYFESGRITELLSLLIHSLDSYCLGEGFVGYTHTQRAQKITFFDYLAAYVDMFGRDLKRLESYQKGIIVQIGSGAIKGTTLTKQYDFVCKDFLKENPALKASINPLDNVSDRDFIIEFLSTLAIIQMHLSRLSEDLILYSTSEFNFIDLPEEFCTGSSLMPHKKNPDFLELVRGNTGKLYGNLFSILTIMKGLPLSYNRDMQLDKEPLFSSVETIKKELSIFAQFVKGIKLNKEAISLALNDEKLYATDLAEYLVMKKVPFQKAHEIIGNLISYSINKGILIKDMTDADLKRFSSLFTKKNINELLKKYRGK